MPAQRVPHCAFACSAGFGGRQHIYDGSAYDRPLPTTEPTVRTALFSGLFALILLPAIAVGASLPECSNESVKEVAARAQNRSLANRYGDAGAMASVKSFDRVFTIHNDPAGVYRSCMAIASVALGGGVVTWELRWHDRARLLWSVQLTDPAIALAVHSPFKSPDPGAREWAEKFARESEAEEADSERRIKEARRAEYERRKAEEIEMAENERRKKADADAEKIAYQNSLAQQFIGSFASPPNFGETLVVSPEDGADGYRVTFLSPRCGRNPFVGIAPRLGGPMGSPVDGEVGGQSCKATLHGSTIGLSISFGQECDQFQRSGCLSGRDLRRLDK